MSAAPTPAAVWRAQQQPAPPATIGGLKRIRWAVRATLLLGVAASVAANILHAQPHLVSQLIAAWPPIALLLTVELISRIPVHRKLLAAARLLATTAIAGIASWVSYWHMVGVAARYGETGLSAYLLPLSVDGLVIVASISLVELTGRLHAANSVSLPAQPAPSPTSPARPGTGRPAVAPHVDPPGAPVTATRPDEPPDGAPAPAQTVNQAQADQRAPTANQGPAPQVPARDQPPWHGNGADCDDGTQHGKDGHSHDTRQRRGAATRKAVIDTYLQDPTMHPTTIAEKVGTSERTVRRHLDQLRANAGT